VIRVKTDHEIPRTGKWHELSDGRVVKITGRFGLGYFTTDTGEFFMPDGSGAIQKHVGYGMDIVKDQSLPRILSSPGFQVESPGRFVNEKGDKIRLHTSVLTIFCLSQHEKIHTNALEWVMELAAKKKIGKGPHQLWFEDEYPAYVLDSRKFIVVYDPVGNRFELSKERVSDSYALVIRTGPKLVRRLDDKSYRVNLTGSRPANHTPYFDSFNAHLQQDTGPFGIPSKRNFKTSTTSTTIYSTPPAAYKKKLVAGSEKPQKIEILDTEDDL
jgi:hypothetical protein